MENSQAEKEVQKYIDQYSKLGFNRSQLQSFAKDMKQIASQTTNKEVHAQARALENLV